VTTTCVRRPVSLPSLPGSGAVAGSTGTATGSFSNVTTGFSIHQSADGGMAGNQSGAVVHAPQINLPKGYVGAYSPERRRDRIQRFFEKRERRVWTKKVR